MIHRPQLVSVQPLCSHGCLWGSGAHFSEVLVFVSTLAAWCGSLTISLLLPSSVWKFCTGTCYRDVLQERKISVLFACLISPLRPNFYGSKSYFILQSWVDVTAVVIFFITVGIKIFSQVLFLSNECMSGMLFFFPPNMFRSYNSPGCFPRASIHSSNVLHWNSRTMQDLRETSELSHACIEFQTFIFAESNIRW